MRVLHHWHCSKLPVSGERKRQTDLSSVLSEFKILCRQHTPPSFCIHGGCSHCHQLLNITMQNPVCRSLCGYLLRAGLVAWPPLDERAAGKGSTVSPLHMNFQVANFQRWGLVFHQPQAWRKLQFVLSPSAGDPSALPSPTSSPSSSQWLFLPLHSMPAPVWQLYCTIVLFKVL